MLSLRFLFIFFLGSFSTLLGSPAQAQINPDQTLGTEASIVTPNVEVRGELADLIEGGAARGPNLFHSFSDFNVLEAERVYFANPAGIESILSRVTGNDLSNIFGTLGVDGTADLFLINPNGIVFGSEVNLDVEGSLYATTAEAVALGEGVFSATAPEQSQLLVVTPDTSFFNYLTADSGDIVNRGQIAVGGDATLTANDLDLQGQVAAGGDLSLLATDTVQIRDTTETPFVAFAGGDLLVQGNQQVDIVALSHPESGLFSYGDMALRSAAPVGGDAHYFSGGSFRVENLNKFGGELFSPIDPIIRAYGDVLLEGYVGTSLHIIAGGSVAIGTVRIDAPETGDVGVDFLRETVRLSDGTLIDINGEEQPTLDVRAGVRPSSIGTFPIENVSGQNPETDLFINGSLPPTLSGAHIVVGDIQTNAPNSLVLLTNNFSPNETLLTGDILITGGGFYGRGINASSSSGKGGTVFLDSRNNITFIESAISTTSSELSGDIVLLSDNSVTFDGADGTRPTGTYSNIISGRVGTGGNVRVSADNVEVLNGAQLNTTNFGRGDAGNVNINARETARFEGSNLLNGNASGAFSSIGSNGEGNSGNIQVTATNLEVLDGAQLSAVILGKGNSGDVILNIRGTALFSGVNAYDTSPSAAYTSIQANGKGEGGDVQITANELVVSNGARLGADIAGSGRAGDLILNVAGTARFDNRGTVTSLNSSLNQGEGGNLRLTASNLYVANGARLSAGSRGNGNAGDIYIYAREIAHFEGANSAAISSIEPSGEGEGGDVYVTATNLEVLDGAQLITSVFGKGTAGNIVLNIDETIRLEDRRTLNVTDPPTSINSGVADGGEGQGGNLRITAANLEVINGGQLVTGTFGNGNSGNIVLNIRETARLEGINSVANVPNSSIRSGIFTDIESGEGQSGDIEISANNLLVRDGAQIASSVEGIGHAGDIFLNISENIIFDGVSILDGQPSSALSTIVSDSEGESGNIKITASNLSVLNGARVSNGVDGRGNAGEIALTIRNGTRIEGFSFFNGGGSRVSSSVGTEGEGEGGNIKISTGYLEILNGAQLTTSTFGSGDAGDIILDVDNGIHIEGNGSDNNSPANISSSVLGGKGAAGTIQITANDLEVLYDAQISSTVSGVGNAGNISLNIRNMARFDAASPENDSRSTVSSSVEQGEGRSGDVRITAGSLEVLNGAQLSSGNFARGDAGNVILVIRETARFDRESSADDGFASGAFSSIAENTEGNGGNVEITASDIFVSNGARLDARSFGMGNAGNVTLNARRSTVFDITQPSFGQVGGAFSGIETTGNGQGGDVRIISPQISILNGSQVGASSSGLGNAGNTILEGDTIIIDGVHPLNVTSSGAFSSIQPGGRGEGGEVRITSTNLSVTGNAILSSESLGRGNAGSILVDIQNRLQVENGSITTSSRSGAGGEIRIAAGSIVLRDDSDIQTFVNAGDNNGGNITIISDALVALGDSDILAFSSDGKGGDIDLTQTTLFSKPLNPISENLTQNELAELEGNNRVDINATGGTEPGRISTNGSSPAENNLAELPDNLVNSEALVATSCIARSADTNGTFTLTGSDRLPQTPTEALPNPYAVGTVQPTPTSTATPAFTTITEPSAIYQLADGRLVMNRECEG